MAGSVPRIAFSFLIALLWHSGFLSQAGAAEPVGEEGDDGWFLEDDPVVQVSEGEIIFLTETLDTDVLLLRNKMTIDADSLDGGWVKVEQCYEHLDPVPDMAVVYRYTAMRALRILSARNIDQARVQGQSVEMVDVQRDASLCVELEAVKFHHLADGSYVLKNGPFHRRFLDGFFPFRVTTDIYYPDELLEVMGTEPAVQPGFAVNSHNGLVEIDARFAGTLRIKVFFKARESVQ